MRILIPLPFDIACLQHGRNLRIVHLLRELACRHQVTCAIADERIGEAAKSVLPAIEVAAMPDHSAHGNITASCFEGSWLMRRAASFFGYDPMFGGWVDRLAGCADVVLGFDLSSALYVSPLNRTVDRLIPTVCDLIDDPWLTYRSIPRGKRWTLGGLKNAVALGVMRRRLLSRMDMLVAVAPPDAESLFRATGRPVRVVPNGVEIPASATAARNDKPLVVFTGAMNFSPNEQAADYLVNAIWPHVLRAVPQARLALVGANPTPRVQGLSNRIGVVVTGRVPDLGAWLRQARVAAAPMLSGTGMKNKVLEACANACPVVATSNAIAGIPSGPRNGILVADDPAAFAAQIIRLLNDAASADKLGRTAQEMVRHQFSWQSASQTLESVLLACAASSKDYQDTPSETRTAEIDGRFRRYASVGKEATHAVS